MQSTASRLSEIIDQHIPALRAMPDEKMSYKPSPQKWSKREILGHLIDSAQNNARRFIVAQYEDNPHIIYNQDTWVNVTGYQQYPLADLVELWYLLNKHIAIILKNMSPDRLLRKCSTGDIHDLQWLATDYIKHLEHHLHQVLDLEPVAYP